MPERKLIIFDFDGTLVESHQEYTNALREFSESRGLPWDSVKMGIGYTHPNEKDLGWGVPLEKQESLLNELNNFYFDELIQNKRFVPTIFPYARETVEALAAEYDLSIITARNRRSLQAVLEYYQLTQFFPMFRSLCCATDRGYAIKPAPDAVYCVMKESGHKLEDIVVIGDTTADIQMANAAGVKSIAALWGVHSEELLHSVNPTMSLGKIQDLPQAVKAIFN